KAHRLRLLGVAAGAAALPGCRGSGVRKPIRRGPCVSMLAPLPVEAMTLLHRADWHFAPETTNRESSAQCNEKAGGEHESAAAEFPSGRDTRGSGCDASLSAGADGWASQQRQGKRRLYPEFFRHVGPRLHPRL